LAILFGLSFAACSASSAQVPKSVSAWSPGSGFAAGKYIDLPGVRLWYRDTGGSGQVIILLHANTGTSASFDNQLADFYAAGYRVIAFDRRGWGKSVAIAGSGSQPGTVAEDLQSLVEFLKLDRFNLVGVAGGGFVVLDYSAWHPERLINAVVAASAGSIQDK